MRKFIIPPALVMLLAVLACNAPTNPTALPSVENSTPIAAVPSVETQISQPTFELPDIAGTANALASVTPDPNVQAHIGGTIRYPSEGNSAVRIYALAPNGQYYQFVTTAVNQGAYSIEVPPGEYYILANLEETPGFEAGYTGLGQCLAQHELHYDACPNHDHALIAVHVQPGQSLEDIDLIDWFPPDGTFPPVP